VVDQVDAAQAVGNGERDDIAQSRRIVEGMDGARGAVVAVDAAADLVGAAQEHAADQDELGIAVDLEAQSPAEPRLAALGQHDQPRRNLARRAADRHGG
jgi:hypothetical protein